MRGHGRADEGLCRRPALGFADHKVAKYLNACDGFQFFRIDKISVDLPQVRLAEQLHQIVSRLGEIVRQSGDTETLLAGARERENVVDLEERFARACAIAPGGQASGAFRKCR